jgi:phospholipase A1
MREINFHVIAIIASITFVFFSTLSHAEQSAITLNPSGAIVTKQELTAGKEKMSLLERRKTEEEKISGSPFFILPHRQNYFLLVNYESHPNTEIYENSGEDLPKNYEAKFQLSFKVLMWKKMFGDNGDLYAAFTQRSYWQLYDKVFSSPFRETNYEPEVYIKFDKEFNLLGLRNRLITVGVNHQSNGQSEPLSRSWNRIYAAFVAERGNFVIMLKPWYRIPEKEEDDDNPDIAKYMGYGELTAAYRFEEDFLKGHVLSFMLRNNLRTSENKGAIELGWSFPVTEKVRGYVQYFNGYGESLIDYNDTTNRIGFGVMLNDWI